VLSDSVIWLRSARCAGIHAEIRFKTRHIPKVKRKSSGAKAVSPVMNEALLPNVKPSV
jgi:hypothetical protein